MSSKPIFYNSNDAGSPGASPAGNDLQKMLTILKACLVDGYGDKPAAGWRMVHEHPRGFSITNGNGVLNIVAGANGHPTDQPGFYIAQEATDTSDALIKGINLRSNLWAPELGMTGAKHQLSTNIRGWSKWVVVANNKFVNLFVLGPMSYIVNYPEHVLSISFGSPKSVNNNFVCIGDSTTRYGKGSVLNDLVTNEFSVKNAVVYPRPSSYSGYSSNGASSEGDIYLTPVRLGHSNTYAGYAPGLAVDNLYTSTAMHWDSIFNKLGFPTNNTDFFQHVGEVVPYGDHGIAYIYGQGQSYFITDDPKFW